MASKGPRILLSAGEPSGDLHGGPVVAALRARWPDAEIVAFGGPKMEAAGADVRWRMERYSALGFAEVVASIPPHVGQMREMERALDERPFDLVIPIDYPGFNLRLAERAHRRGVKVLYFIPPQVWAWHRSRVKQLRRNCDALAVILPFEETFYRNEGISAKYVGNPLVDRSWPDREGAWARLAGCYEEIDWSVTPRIAESYARFQDPDLALRLIGGVFVPQDRDGCFRPLGTGGTP